MPERITRSRPILEFFRPSKPDEQKSIQINVDKSKLIRKTSIDLSNSSKLATYRCIQDFNANGKNEMSIKQKDIVKILEKNDNGLFNIHE